MTIKLICLIAQSNTNSYKLLGQLAPSRRGANAYPLDSGAEIYCFGYKHHCKIKKEKTELVLSSL